MQFFLSIFALLFVEVTLARGQELKMISCMATKCLGKTISCVTNKGCKKSMDCSRACPQDGSEESFRCQMLCAEKADSEKFSEFTACAVEKGCFPKAKASTCALPRDLGQLSPMTLSDLEGDWWVVRGLSRTFDCWSCQRMSFKKEGALSSSYDYHYSPIGKAKTIRCQLEKLEAPGQFDVHYKTNGIDGLDHWYVLDHVGDFALIYYCGETAVHNYRGGVVMSRGFDTSIPRDVVNSFKRTLETLDIEVPVALEDFCTPDNSGCGL